MFKQLHRVILTGAKRGRIAALHKHGTKRVRKKYASAVVFLRSLITAEALPPIIRSLQENHVMSKRGWIRFCVIARKCGLDARVLRQC